jgi:ectoine hydroxylase-related dioxygenase (phytanoyl-CoA dioxygenase family)
MPGAVPLLGKAGDATVFPHAIWHGPSPNRSGKARKTIQNRHFGPIPAGPDNRV